MDLSAKHLLNGEYILICSLCVITSVYFGYAYIKAIRAEVQQTGWAILCLGIAIAFFGHAVDYLYWYIARVVPGWYFPMSQNYPIIALIKAGPGIGAALHLRIVFQDYKNFSWIVLAILLLVAWVAASLFSAYLPGVPH